MRSRLHADGLRTSKSNGSAVYTYSWNENRQLKSMTWDYGYAIFSYDVNGTPYSVKNYDAILDVERTYLYVTNLQGDVLSVVGSATGQTAVSYVYDAWGKLISKTGTSSDYASIYEYNPLTYRGYIYDSETGFYYLQSRYYDPAVGRFFNADEVKYVNGANLFSFCMNDPINNNNYTGYFGTPIQWACAVIGGIAGWFFGDYVARSIGLFDGRWYQWQTYAYWAVRSLVVVGGAILGYIAGTALLKIITSFIISNPSVAYRLPKFLLWFLGIGDAASSQVANELFSRYAGHIFSKQHLSEGIMRLGTSQRDIFDKLFRVVSMNIQKAVTGDNEIRTIFYGLHVTIKFNFVDGVIRSMDAFIGWSERYLGHLIT